MAKWIWRLYAGEQGLWAKILRAKYLGERDLLADKHRPGSQFWNAIQKIKHVFGMGARHAIHNGRATRFWVDWWHEKGPLKDLFPGLFAIASEPLATVATLFLGNQCRLTFRRELGFGERVELANVARLVETIHLSEPQDRISWSLEPNGKFSVRSLYKSLCQGIPHKYYGIVWEIKVPLKVRIFLWQLSKRRLPSNDNIRRRKGPSNGTCALCLEVEDNNHIFFRCPLACFMWSAVRDLLGCSWNPTCFADIFRYMCVHVGQTRRVLWLACAALLWSLWNVRNKFTIEGSFPTNPANGLYKMTVYLQAWKLLARRGDRQAVELVIGRIRALHASIRDSV
jgi:hypothetical protein